MERIQGFVNMDVSTCEVKEPQRIADKNFNWNDEKSRIIE